VLENVARERLVKTRQAGKGLECAMVICILWRLAVALKLLVVPSRVYKWPVNRVTNPNPVCSPTLSLANISKESNWLGFYDNTLLLNSQ
jgi:hypothetical protein